MILITGATGVVGSELVRLLAARGVTVRAFVRSQAAAKSLAALPGVELAVGTFEDTASVEAALGGVERAFLLTPSSERSEAQQLAFIETARRIGLAHIVKLSQFAAAEDSPVRFLRYHAIAERAIKSAGLAYTFLRHNLFMQGLLGFRDSIVQKGEFYAPAGEAKVSIVDVRDIAEVAAAALTQPGHEGKIYDLTGPEALTHTEAAAILSGATGRPVTFVDVPPEAMREAVLAGGMGPWQAEGLVEDYAHYRRGEAAAVASGVQEATGRPPRSFATFARDYSQAFR